MANHVCANDVRIHVPLDTSSSDNARADTHAVSTAAGSSIEQENDNCILEEKLIRPASYVEQIWKTWKFLAQENHVHEEVLVDASPTGLTAVPIARHNFDKNRNRTCALDNSVDELHFAELCVAFSEISVPWCEIHTRSGKLNTSRRMHVDVLPAKLGKKPNQGRRMTAIVEKQTTVKKKWRSFRSPFSEIRRRKTQTT